MKALIVDDEKHVRDAIRILVDWSSYGIHDVLEAPEGQTAIRIIEAESPDIIFTDMLMPLVSGSELLEWIHQHAPSSKTIVISGHDDFDYVRHTVKYGGMDYILKPIDEAELNEALLKAINARKSDELIRSQSQNQNMTINQIKPIYWDKVFSNLMEEPSIYPTIANELMAEFSIHPHTRQGRVAILSLETMQKKIKDKFASNLDLLCYSIANITNEFLRKDQVGYAFRNWSNTHELVIIAWRNVETLPELIKDINEGIYRTFAVRFDFGIGTVKSFPLDIPASYKEANSVLKQRNLLQRGNRIYIYTLNDHPRMTTLHFSKHQEKIRLALLSSSHEQIQTAVNDWFKDIRTVEAITTEHLDLWIHEFTVFKSRCLKELYSEEQVDKLSSPVIVSNPFIIPVDEEGRLSIPLWQDEFTQLMLNLSTFLTNQHARSHNIIYEIAEYIQDHYQEDIALQHIAERYFLSREYISRKFKVEMNENISDFIERIRIGKAKLLLLNPLLKIIQIAEMVGYQDEKYFSKVFKKTVGISPNQYRKDQARAAKIN